MHKPFLQTLREHLPHASEPPPTTRHGAPERVGWPELPETPQVRRRANDPRAWDDVRGADPPEPPEHPGLIR